MAFWLWLLPHLIPLELHTPALPFPVAGAVRLLTTASEQTRGWQSAQTEPGFSEYTYTTFNSDRLDEQLGRYLSLVATQGPPDILLVGSSRVLQGIDPHVLQQSLKIQGYGDLRVYNFGINGATAQVVDFVIRRLLTPEQLPRMIVWADGSRAFNSGRVDRTMTAIANSEGHRLLTLGLRPTHPKLPPPKCYDLPFSPDTTASARTNSCPQLGISSLLLRSLIRGAPNLKLATTDELGFSKVDDRFDPKLYYQTRPRINGRYDGDYLNFNLGGIQAIATANLLNYTRRQNLPLIFVNLPLTRDYLDPVRQTYEQQFQRAMQQWATKGLIYVNLLSLHTTPSPLQNPQYFADPSHINRHGAAAVARTLARDSRIPWQQIFKEHPQTPD